VKENVAVLQQVNVVMPGMSLLRSGRIVLPDHIAFGIADGYDVLAVGCADEHKAVVLSAY
jgi:hypothetical protein